MGKISPSGNRLGNNSAVWERTGPKIWPNVSLGVTRRAAALFFENDYTERLTQSSITDIASCGAGGAHKDSSEN